MYNKVKKILDISREKEVDILVACDMAINEERNEKEAYNEACNVIQSYYNYITAARNADDEGAIKNLCNLYEAGEFEKIRELIKK